MARVRIRAARGMGGGGGWHWTGKRQVWDIDASDLWDPTAGQLRGLQGGMGAQHRDMDKKNRSRVKRLTEI